MSSVPAATGSSTLPLDCPTGSALSRFAHISYRTFDTVKPGTLSGLAHMCRQQPGEIRNRRRQLESSGRKRHRVSRHLCFTLTINPPVPHSTPMPGWLGSAERLHATKADPAIREALYLALASQNRRIVAKDHLANHRSLPVVFASVCKATPIDTLPEPNSPFFGTDRLCAFRQGRGVLCTLPGTVWQVKIWTFSGRK